MSESADIRLRIGNDSENVAVVREMLAGVGEVLALPSGELDAIRTAVSEACNNVVTHAYGEDEGLMEVDVSASTGRLLIMVRDHGTGIQPHFDLSQDAFHGIGIAVIQAFTDSVELRSTAGEGTEVRMEFLVGDDSSGPLSLPLPAAADGDGHLPLGDPVVTLAPGRLTGPVLAHLAAALAARARFTISRLSDAQLLADAVAAHAPGASASGRISVGFTTDMRVLELRVGPLRPGTGHLLVNQSPVGGLEPVIARLTDEVTVEQDGTGELLMVRMRDPR